MPKEQANGSGGWWAGELPNTKQANENDASSFGHLAQRQAHPSPAIISLSGSLFRDGTKEEEGGSKTHRSAIKMLRREWRGKTVR